MRALMRVACLFVHFFSLVNSNYFCETKRCGKVNTPCQMEPCRPVRRCGSGVKFSTFSASEEEHATNLHNSVRDSVARGDVPRYPRGSNIKQIRYSKELGFMAQCWANMCTKAPDSCRETPKFTYVGSNRAILKRPHSCQDTCSRESLREAIDEWYHPISLKSIGFERYNPSPRYNYFVQLIWAETTHVGCAVTFYDTLASVVCMYGPSIMAGQPVYLQGNPCTDCECIEGASPNLCIVPQDDYDDRFVPPYTIGRTASLLSFNYLHRNFLPTYLFVILSSN